MIRKRACFNVEVTVKSKRLFFKSQVGVIVSMSIDKFKALTSTYDGGLVDVDLTIPQATYQFSRDDMIKIRDNSYHENIFI